MSFAKLCAAHRTVVFGLLMVVAYTIIGKIVFKSFSFWFYLNAAITGCLLYFTSNQFFYFFYLSFISNIDSYPLLLFRLYKSMSCCHYFFVYRGTFNIHVYMPCVNLIILWKQQHSYFNALKHFKHVFSTSIDYFTWDNHPNVQFKIIYATERWFIFIFLLW